MEIIPEKLSFVALRRPDGLSASPIARKSLCFGIDNELVRFLATRTPKCSPKTTIAILAFSTASMICMHLIFVALVAQLFEPFFAEFGPLNLGLAYRFCEKLTSYLKVCVRPCKKKWDCAVNEAKSLVERADR